MVLRGRKHTFVAFSFLGLMALCPLRCLASRQPLLRDVLKSRNWNQAVVRGEAETGVASTTDPRSEKMYSYRYRSQKLDRRVLQDDSNADCALCRGLPMPEPDKIVETKFGNATCSEVNNFFLSEANRPLQGCPSAADFNLYFDLCCKASVPQYECETNIHDLLFGLDYNSAVPPITDGDNPLKVHAFLQYETVQSIDVGEGTATLFVTLVLEWVDPRLKWEVEDYDTCSNQINVFVGHEIEQTTVWFPEFDLLNVIEGFENMPTRKALVFSDGTVRFQVIGRLTAFCAFSGLANIPFDILGCQLLIGSTIREDSPKIEYELVFPESVHFGGFEVVYNEWKVIPELAEKGEVFNGSSFYFNFYFQRAKAHYVNNILIPTIILTYLSFFTFFLDLRVGERLGFAMALALVVVAQQIITSDMLPVSDERLWLGTFVAYSFFWVLYCVIQSIIVGFLFFIREDRQEKKAQSQHSEMIEQEADAVKREEKMTLTKHEENGVVAFVAEPHASHSRPKKDSCFYTFSMRKFDMFSFVFGSISYTIFILAMFGSLHSGAWLTNEPAWFRNDVENILTRIYNNSDPNS